VGSLGRGWCISLKLGISSLAKDGDPFCQHISPDIVDFVCVNRDHSVSHQVLLNPCEHFSSMNFPGPGTVQERMSQLRRIWKH